MLDGWDDQPEDQPHPREPHKLLNNTTSTDPDGEKRNILVWGRARRAAQGEEATPTRDKVAAAALWLAGIGISAVIIGGAIVVYDAQYKFALDHNGGNTTSAVIQAAIPDLVWIVMAALGLSQALRGRSSLRATSSIVLFFALSLGAQLLHAEQSAEGYLVAAITPIALALMLESLLHGVRHWALARDGHTAPSTPLVLRILSGLLTVAVMPWAWLLRLCLDRSTTWGGMRTWLLDMIPYAPGRTRAQDEAAAALERAGTAEQIREHAEGQAAELVAAADDQAADLVAQARTAAEERVEEVTAAAAARVEEVTAETAERIAAQAEEHDHRQQELRGQIEELRAQSGKSAAELRAEMERGLEQAQERHREEAAQRDRQHQRDQQAAAQRLAAAQDALEGQRAEAARLQRELEETRGEATGRQQVAWIHDELGRAGDHRYGREDYLDELTEVIWPRTNLTKPETVRRYLRLELAEKGHSEARVTGVNGSMIGGSR